MQSSSNQESAAASIVEVNREICGTLELAEQCEWLVTNGLGSYASGTVSGNLTRRYHGLLVAALDPPVKRTLLVSKADDTVRYDQKEFALSTNRWQSGEVQPAGYVNIESFCLDGTTPVWHFTSGDAVVEKRIWMRQGENTTYLQYTLLRGTLPAEIELKILVNYRDFHSLTRAADLQITISPVKGGVQIAGPGNATPFYIFCAEASSEPRRDWYLGYFLPQERDRGLEDHEDHLLAAVVTAKLLLHQSVTLVFTTDKHADLDAAQQRSQREALDASLLANWSAKNVKASFVAPAWIRQLILAADQFIVKRNLPGESDARSIIAGYHWFADWGRDTMIALPGLTLTTGRPDIAKNILLAFTRYVDGGMLPNNFPDAGGRPQYNTVDAALWFFEAIRQYFEATQDLDTLSRLFPVLAQIVTAHLHGTRYNIRVDKSDGLLYAGEPGSQLTWMDAKVGNQVVTPRIGKPVEINALWYNALESMAAFSGVLKVPAAPFQKLAAMAKQNFSKFWNSAAGCCYDVVGSPTIGNDSALRPNQIFAVSLPKSPLSVDQQKSVVNVCSRRLLTSFGLRSLPPGEPAYRGHHVGGPGQRDAAYHQGSVWGWLLGPFALAHLRVYGDPKMAASFLEPLGKQISARGLGTLSEIFDGDAPFYPRGCIAQAWTVAEVLRAWHTINSHT